MECFSIQTCFRIGPYLKQFHIQHPPIQIIILLYTRERKSSVQYKFPNSELVQIKGVTLLSTAAKALKLLPTTIASARPFLSYHHQTQRRTGRVEVQSVHRLDHDRAADNGGAQNCLRKTYRTLTARYGCCNASSTSILRLGEKVKHFSIRSTARGFALGNMDWKDFFFLNGRARMYSRLREEEME